MHQCRTKEDHIEIFPAISRMIRMTIPNISFEWDRARLQRDSARMQITRKSVCSSRAIQNESSFRAPILSAVIMHIQSWALRHHFWIPRHCELFADKWQSWMKHTKRLLKRKIHQQPTSCSLCRGFWGQQDLSRRSQSVDLANSCTIVMLQFLRFNHPSTDYFNMGISDCHSKLETHTKKHSGKEDYANAHAWRTLMRARTSIQTRRHVHRHRHTDRHTCSKEKIAGAVCGANPTYKSWNDMMLRSFSVLKYFLSLSECDCTRFWRMIRMSVQSFFCAPAPM